MIPKAMQRFLSKDKLFIGSITSYAKGVSGDIYSCGDDKIVFENFKYDGLGPDAFFWVGTKGDKASSNVMLLPYPFEGKFYDSKDLNAPILDKAYDGNDGDNEHEPEIPQLLEGCIHHRIRRDESRPDCWPELVIAYMIFYHEGISRRLFSRCR